MVATSQALATRAGVRMLERGGNAVDAALAAAAVLCVTEPMSTGIGGDAFALVWDGEGLHGLDAAGPAPREADPVEPVEELGPRSVTVPGAVAGWARHDVTRSQTTLWTFSASPYAPKGVSIQML